jgi:hypothetical protein
MTVLAHTWPDSPCALVPKVSGSRIGQDGVLQLQIPGELEPMPNERIGHGPRPGFVAQASTWSRFEKYVGPLMLARISS